MDRRRLSLLFGLLIATSILTPQGGAQEGIKFEMPKDDVKKKAVKPAAPSPATVEMLNGQSARIDSLTDGDAVKLKVTLDKPVELAYVASFKFADDERQIDNVVSRDHARVARVKLPREPVVLQRLMQAIDAVGDIERRAFLAFREEVAHRPVERSREADRAGVRARPRAGRLPHRTRPFASRSRYPASGRDAAATPRRC